MFLTVSKKNRRHLTKVISYGYTDPFGKRHYIYSKDLKELRKKEEDLMRNQLDGLDYYVAGKSDLNFVFDRYMATKKDLRISTRVSYNDVYDRYVRKDFGKMKLSSIKYSDVMYFYNKLLDERGVHIGTVEYVQRLIHPAFEMAVKDNIYCRKASFMIR